MSLTVFDPFSGPQIERIINTTESQSEIWTDCLIGGEDARKAYIISSYLEIKGTLDVSAIEKAIKTVIKRHESLRSVFSADGLIMTIFEEIEPLITFQDLSTVSISKRESLLEDYLKKEVETNFDLVNGPLIRFGIIKLSDLEYRFVITTHHIICDGWSMSIILQDLSTLYSAYVKNISPTIQSPASFSNYADELQTLIESKEYKKIESFWVNLYQQHIPVVDLPTDYTRPSLRTYKCDRIDIQLNNTLVENLKKTGAQSGCGFVSTLISAFEIFLYQLTGDNDLTLGLPTAGQSSSGMTHLVGHCVNLLPLRTHINLGDTFLSYLKTRKNQIFDAYEHDQISFGQLLQKLPISRDPARIPLVPVVINFETNPEEGISFEGLSTALRNNAKLCETFEIFLNTVISKDNVRLEWSYNTNLFSASTINDMITSFEGLLETLVLNHSDTISSIVNKKLFSKYDSLNQTQSSYPDEPLNELLNKQAEITPSKIAIEFNDLKITYYELQKQSNQLAHYFIEQGIKPGDNVGVSLHRGPELLATLMSILQCGAAYVPLDPNYPKSRLEFILADSQAKYLITNKNNSLDFNNSIHPIYLDDALSHLENFSANAPKISVSQKNAAYILYTSGSTGKPKGVTITHKNLVNLLFSIAKEPGITENDRLLAITTISFDIAGVELFLPLLKGATIVMTDTETARNGELLLKILETKDISILQATPTTWKMLLESNWNKSLNIKGFCGGEALTYDLAQKILAKCKELWNMYGPTETTIYSIIKEIKANDSLITIGKPIANTEVYILNQEGQLVPPGVIGEIVIAGDGVGQGYLNRPDLTSDKFIDNIFESEPGSKLYRTGDLGKLLPSNEILCLGRIDHQIKIRGFRIEPEEIENTLMSLHDVEEAVVLAQNHHLIAFVKPIEFDEISNEQINQWKSHLASQLPAYFVPNQIKLIKEFPITPNGKLDRNALLNSETIKVDRGVIIEPTTETEKLVAEIWKKHLAPDSVDIRNDFFELGGNSLIAIQVMNELERTTGKRLPLSSLFEYSTIETFSRLLNEDIKTDRWSALVPIKPKGTKTPIYIVHGAGMEVLIFKQLADNLDVNQPVYGLQAKELFNANEEFDSIEKIAAHYVEAVVENNPHGPYALAGYSFGGIIAYEMARKFLELGKKVSMVGLFDTVIEPNFHHSSPFRKKMAMMFYQNKRRFHILKEMTKSWKNFKSYINNKKEFLLDNHIRTKNFDSVLEQIKHEEFLKTEEIIQPIKANYWMTPLNIKVDLFRAKEQLSYVDESIFKGWEKFALKGVITHKIPGNHDTILLPQHIKDVANIFQNVLDLRNGIN
jgi:amino acid adenylation domain-containing protein